MTAEMNNLLALEIEREHLEVLARRTANPVIPMVAASTTAILLDQVHDYISRYVLMPGTQYVDVAALWVLHTYAMEASDTTPRLVFKSPEKESGKTRALEVLDQLVAAPLAMMNSTIAGIFRTLADGPATILFDEVDAVFGAKAAREHEDLRALLNAGYRRGASVLRVTGEGAKMRARKFPVYAATALACIGSLPDTIESRSIIIPMRRRAPDEQLQAFRLREASALSEGLRRELEAWTADVGPALSAARPHMPDGVTDRAADIWEPLIAVADLAGGDWPHRARQAAVTIVGGRVAEDASTGVRLLADIKEVIDGADRMSSVGMVAALNALDESGWGAWHDGRGMTQRDLAYKLRPYAIHPKTIKLADDSTAKGYLREHFLDAWSRYLRTVEFPPPVERNERNERNPDRIQVTEVTEVTVPAGGERDAHRGVLAGRKRCPDGHQCSQSPDGSLTCCGHPA